MSAKKDNRKKLRQQQRRAEIKKESLSVASAVDANSQLPNWDLEFLFSEEDYCLPKTNVKQLADMFSKMHSISGMTVGQLLDNNCSAHSKRLAQYDINVVDRLCPCVQRRLQENETYKTLFESDGIWRFRLNGTQRVYAFRTDGSTFKVVWWDPEHEIYRTEKN